MSNIPIDPTYTRNAELKNGCITIVNEDERSCTFPVKIDICDNCRGEGRHLLTSLRDIAFSSEDEDYDPDFMEEMREGQYDQSCMTCNGTGRLYVINEAYLDEKQTQFLEEIKEDRRIAAEIAYEDKMIRRMECGYRY